MDSAGPPAFVIQASNVSNLFTVRPDGTLVQTGFLTRRIVLSLAGSLALQLRIQAVGAFGLTSNGGSPRCNTFHCTFHSDFFFVLCLVATLTLVFRVGRDLPVCSRCLYGSVHQRVAAGGHIAKSGGQHCGKYLTLARLCWPATLFLVAVTNLAGSDNSCH